MHDTIDDRALSRLRWRCRRGLLENDLFVERFFASRQAGVTARQAAALGVLMDLADNDLLDLLLRRREPEGELARDDVIEVLGLMRSPAPVFKDNNSNKGPPDGALDAPAVETNPQPPPHPPTKEKP